MRGTVKLVNYEAMSLPDAARCLVAHASVFTSFLGHGSASRRSDLVLGRERLLIRICAACAVILGGYTGDGRNRIHLLTCQ